MSTGRFRVKQMADGDWIAYTDHPYPIGIFAAGRELALQRLAERVEWREDLADRISEGKS